MIDLIKRAAECECPPNMGCNVPSDHCRCELIEDMVNRIETLETALRQFADEKNWEEWVGWVGDEEPQDIARSALAGEKKE